MLRKLTPKGQRLALLHALSINHDQSLSLSLFLSPPCSRDRVGPGYVLLAGGTAGIMNWISCIAQDTIKSRYQTAPAGKYTGLTQVFMEIVSSIIAISTIMIFFIQCHRFHFRFVQKVLGVCFKASLQHCSERSQQTLPVS